MPTKPISKTGYIVKYETSDGLVREVRVLAYKPEDAEMLFMKWVGYKLNYKVLKVGIEYGH